MSNEGKKVRVNYIGTFDDGTVFDSSVERGEPLEFTCMAGMMIPGFDAAVNEMAVGETKKVHIPAADAYGERDEQLSPFTKRIEVKIYPSSRRGVSFIH